jgi:hypothetical protein
LLQKKDWKKETKTQRKTKEIKKMGPIRHVLRGWLKKLKDYLIRKNFVFTILSIWHCTAKETVSKPAYLPPSQWSEIKFWCSLTILLNLEICVQLWDSSLIMLFLHKIK